MNFEIGVFIYSEPEVRAMRAWAEELIACSRPMAAAPTGRRGVLGNIAEDLSRLFAPLL